nr:LemA family protein [Thermophilibacter gallinarum]
MVYTRTYLNIIGADNKCEDAWKVVERQLAARDELVRTLEARLGEHGAASSDILAAVSTARAAVVEAKKPADKLAASEALTVALRDVFAVAERSATLMTRPELVELMSGIAEAENTLAHARKGYDARVREYNSLVTTFPGSKIGGMRYRPRMSLESGRHGRTEQELPWARF